MGKTGSLESGENSEEDDRGELSSLLFGRACAIITEQHASFEAAATRSQEITRKRLWEDYKPKAAKNALKVIKVPSRAQSKTS